MQRFYLKNLDLKLKKIDIYDERIFFQLKKVLRCKVDDKFILFNGNEFEILVKIEKIEKKYISVKFIEKIERDSESDIKLILFQAIPKKIALFELVLQKSVELGVSEIYPLITKRTEKPYIKFDRLKNIIIEASEQCGRSKIPKLHKEISFNESIKLNKNNYIANVNEESKTLFSYKKEINKLRELSIFIGPEGGFTEDEIEFAKQNNSKSFSLGKRILRTETAAISTLSIILL